MPAYLLVRAVDRETPQNAGTYLRGFPVSVMDRNQYLGKQILPNYVQFVITDATADQVKQYCAEWSYSLDWTFTNHDYVNDEHTLNVFNDPTNVSNAGLGALTRTQVESFLNLWSGIVGTVTQNSVEFTVSVLNAIKSEGFWDRLPALFGVVLAETNYDQGTGDHTLTANYSASTFTALEMSTRIADKGCTVDVVDAVNKIITFTINRNDVFNRFKKAVKDKTDRMFQRRKWALDETAMQAAEAAGGSLDVTSAQALNYLQNRLNN